jgi:cytochrome c oxidase assembly factor CtaG
LRVTFAGIYLFTVTSIIMNILLHAHSGLRYVVLGLLIAAIFTAYSNWQKRSQGDSKLYLFTLIATHTQLLIGLVLYFMSPKVNFDLISEKVFRFYSIEHVFMMMIAIVLITVGRVRSKNSPAPTSTGQYFTSTVWRWLSFLSLSPGLSGIWDRVGFDILRQSAIGFLA